MKVFLKKNKKPVAIGLLVLLLFFILIISFSSSKNKDDKNILPPDSVNANVLKQIQQEGNLTAITDFNSINYFVYRGRPMGYQYELLKEYAGHLGVELDLRVDNSLKSKFNCLNRGECDIIGIDLTVTKERSRYVDFTIPHSLSRQVLVQRKPEGYHRMNTLEIEKALIRSQLDLSGKTVYVQRASAFVSRLQNLADEIGANINIKEADYEAEQLVKMVAKGEIDYTVCDEHMAMVNKTYYDNIDINTPVSFPQQLAWAVRKGADSLRLSINSWLADYKKTESYRSLYHKYFVSRKTPHKQNQEYHSMSGGRISLYDELIKKYSEEIDWDWRLLASLIYQESRFQNDIKSWAGAKGLMQLMPETGERFGAEDLDDPEQNIRAGVRFIKFLDKQFASTKIEKEERVKFILASYNVGLGHVQDALRLAEKYEAETTSWEDVGTFLLNKSQPKYYNDPVVKYGYCRGEESYKFVNEVLYRYEHYKRLVPA